MIKNDKGSMSIPVVRSPVRLYWVRKEDNALFVVAATSKTIAARLLHLHTQTLQRDGGIVSSHTHYPHEIDGIKSAAISAVGTVFMLEKSSKQMEWVIQESTVPPIKLAKSLRNHSQQADGPTPVRTLLLSPDVKAALTDAGGVAWLRNKIEAATDDQAVQATRITAQDVMPVPVSMRLSDKHWQRFQSLGGKTWLLHQLSMLTTNSPGS